MELLQEWDWLLWVAMGLCGCWVVLKDAYDVRPTGQGRDES